MNPKSKMKQNIQTEQSLNPKPRYPLSAYNLFFQCERKRILNGTDQLGLPLTTEDITQVIYEHKNKPKRAHRKSHGKISFRELARTVAQRWKKIDKETRATLECEAKREKQEYTVHLLAWKLREDARSSDCSPSIHGEQSKTTNSVSGTGTGSTQGISKVRELDQLRSHMQVEMSRLADEKVAQNLEEPCLAPSTDMFDEEYTTPRLPARHFHDIHNGCSVGIDEIIDMNEMMKSPIFSDAAIVGMDLRELIPQDLDDIFDEESHYTTFGI